MFTKQQIATKRESVRRGMLITSDAVHPTPFMQRPTLPTRPESPFEEASRHLDKAREIAEQLAAVLRQRH